jgi:hypothetical protein
MAVHAERKKRTIRSRFACFLHQLQSLLFAQPASTVSWCSGSQSSVEFSNIKVVMPRSSNVAVRRGFESLS